MSFVNLWEMVGGCLGGQGGNKLHSDVGDHGAGWVLEKFAFEG